MKTSESPFRTKEYVTSSSTTRRSVRPAERKYHGRASTPPLERETTTQTEVKSTEVGSTYVTTESYDSAISPSQTVPRASATVPDLVQETSSVDRASTSPATAETTTQTEIKSTEVEMTARTTKKFAYLPYGEYAGSNSTTERAGTATSPRANTTTRLEIGNVSVYLVEQETTTMYLTTEALTEMTVVLESTAAHQTYSELTATEMQPRDATNTTTECICPICPSCFAEFAGYHLSKDDIAGIAAGMVMLFLAVIVLLLKQCPAARRVFERFTPSRAGSEEVEEPYRPSFHHPGQSHRFRGKGSDDLSDNTQRTRPKTTSHLDGNGRSNNEYDQPEIRQPTHSRIPYAQEKSELRVPPNRKRRVSVEIVDDQPPPPVQVNNGNAPASSMENDSISAEAHDERRHSIELAAASASGLINPLNGQPSASAGLNANVGASVSQREDNVEHEVNSGDGQNHHLSEQQEVNSAPPPPVQASPSRLAASFLDSARQRLFGGENSPNNAAPAGQNRKRNASMPSTAERATTRSVSRGLQNANVPLYENVSLDVVNEG